MTAISNALLASTTIERTDHPHSVDERAAWQRSQQAAGRPVPVAVAVDDDEVIGWASDGDFGDADRWPRYRFTVEHSIHVAESWLLDVEPARMVLVDDREADVAGARAAGLQAVVYRGVHDLVVAWHARAPVDGRAGVSTTTTEL